jgi:hypothetical protein
MSVKKIIILAVAMIFLATPAIADNTPEMDQVACDWNGLFTGNSIKYQIVTDGNEQFGLEINRYSDWTDAVRPFAEYFVPPAQIEETPDYCWNPDADPAGYWSYMTQPQTAATYEWKIKLQMEPESDLNVNVYDCVLKPQGTDLFRHAQQTGRENMTDGSTRFFRSQNPRITVEAYPGSPSRFSPFVMTARTMPNLRKIPLNNRLYTSKANWEESIVLKMPRTGRINRLGQVEHKLIQGDFLKVTVDVPGMHPARLSYGQDNIVLKYIGVVGAATVDGGFRTPVECPND